MKNKLDWIKIWAKGGALAAVAVHLWRCNGHFLTWDGASHLRPALELPMTPFLILAPAFFLARKRWHLFVATILFVALLPEFRLLRERNLRSELANLPADAALALPRLQALHEKYPRSAHVGLLLAELHIAHGDLIATRKSLSELPDVSHDDDLGPRAAHLRYALDGHGNR